MIPTRITFLCLLLISASALAGRTNFLVRNDFICEPEETICIRGTLYYLPDSRVLRLRGRVSRAPGPGWVRILFRGSRDGQLASSVMEFPIRGDHSEIIDFRYIPDNPAIGNWRVLAISFDQDPDAARESRRR